MKTNRRKFIGKALAGGLGAGLPILAAGSSSSIPSAKGIDYSKLDEILR